MPCRGLGDYFAAGFAGRTLFLLRLQKHTDTYLMQKTRYCYDHEIDGVSQATRQIADLQTVRLTPSSRSGD